MQFTKYLLAVLGLIWVVLVPAQNNYRIIRGMVIDGGNAAPLEGVQILAKNSHVASGSQTDGIFAIPITEKDSVLVFQFDSYEKQEVLLRSEDMITVTLQKGTPLSLAKIAGAWRGLFTIKPGVEVPFQFEIASNGEVALHNAAERFPAGEARIRGDSLFIPFPLFENELALSYDNNQLTGVLRRQDLTGRTTPVTADKNAQFLFIENGSTPIKDISGTYDVVFQSPGGKEEKAVGLFKQTGNKVSATFLRITGDARYLDGILEDNQLQLSAFIGSGPTLYKATVKPDGTLSGENINARGGTPFRAVLTPNAALPDAYTLTHLKEGNDKIAFSFPNTAGKLISSADAQFAGKPLIISIGGTWCPNCMDEAGFLAPWYEKNKNRGLEVVALQYERQTDAAFVKNAFERFQKRFNITYPLLLGGTADKQVVVNSLPALQNFLSFPTTIFIDKNGKVDKIHTGFSGPATGSHYTDFIKEFNEEVDKLLK